MIKAKKLHHLLLILITSIFIMSIQGIVVSADGTPPANLNPKVEFSVAESTTDAKQLSVAQFKSLYEENELIMFKYSVTAIDGNVEIGNGFFDIVYDKTLFNVYSVSSEKVVIKGESENVWDAGVNGDTFIFNSNISKTKVMAPLFQQGVPKYIAIIKYELNPGKTLADITDETSLKFGIQNIQYSWNGEVEYIYSTGNTTISEMVVGEVAEEPDPSMKSINVLGGSSNEIVLDDMTKFTLKESNTYEALVNLTYADSKLPLNFENVELNKSNATYKINGNTGSSSTPFKAGDIVSITVTHLETIYTYNIKIGSVATASADNALAGLTAKVSGGNNLITNFNSNTKEYSITVPNSSSSLTIEASLLKTENATVSINGEVVTGTVSGSNKIFSKTISGLTEGTTKVVNVIVTAENGSNNTYKVNITRENKSNVNTINSLVLKMAGKSSINGIFNGNLINITIPAYDNTSIPFDLEMVPTDVNIQGIKYNVNNGTSKNASLSSGKYIASNVYDLSRGQNVTITITVTAQDGSTNDYVLTVEREKSNNTEVSRVDVIQNSTTNTSTRSGNAFTFYSSGNGKIKVSPVLVQGENASFVMKNSSGEIIAATTEIDPSTLSVGSNLFYITVTAENGSATAEYTLEIIVRSKENNLTSYRLYESSNPSNEFLEWNETDVQKVIRIPWTKNTLKVDLKLESSIKSKITITSYNPSTTITNGVTQNMVTISYSFIGTVEQELQIVVSVAAEDTSFTATYNILIIREAADSESRLGKLTVNGIDVPNFSPDTFVYPDVIIVNRDYTTVQVYGTKHEDSKANVSITYNGNTTGIIELNALGGEAKTITIVVTSQSGATSTYTIKVIAGSTNNNIFNVEFTGIPGFTFYPGTTNYTLESPAGNINTVVKVTTDPPYLSKVYIDGILQSTGTKAITLTEGTTRIQIYVVSEAGTKGTTYTFDITRGKASTHKLLESLDVRVDGKIQTLIPVSSPNNPGFNPEIFDYKLRVDYNVTSVYVTATVPTGKASTLIFENGKKDLNTTKTTITIIVEAEDKTKNYYNVEVTRADDNNNILKVILNGVEYDITEFVGNPGDIYKVLTVTDAFPFATKSINVQFQLENANAVIKTTGLTGSNVWTLGDGENNLEFYAQSQAGTDGQKYRIKVTRTAANSDTSLKTLKVKNGSIDILSGLFDSSAKQRTYNVRVDNNVNLLNIEAISNGVNSRVTITPSSSVELKDRVTVITVDVIAENGDIGKHIINVTRANDDSKLYGINIDGNPLVDRFGQAFNQTTLDYTLQNVLYSKNKILFNFDIDSTAKIYFNDVLVSKSYEYSLKEGNNLIKIQIQSDFGTNGDIYKINIYREYASDENELAGIKVNGNSVTDYDNTLPEIVYLPSGLTTATITVVGLPTGATVKYNGNASNVINLNGSNTTTVTITVTSEKGTEKNYVLRVRSASRVNEITNISLSRISGNGEITTPFLFDKNTQTYLITVPYSIDYTNVTVTAPDVKTVYGNGRVDLLTDGVNELTIYAVSESGEEGNIYTIRITRLAPSSNALLDNLEAIEEGNNLLTTFNKNVYTYTLRVDNNITTLDINYLAPKGATVSGSIGSQSLIQKVNVLKVTVVAEDKVTIKTYTITIYRTNDNSNISDILVGENLDPIEDVTTGLGFDLAVKKYNLGKVSYSQDKLKLKVELEDLSAKVLINGVAITDAYDVSLKVGKNTISITVKSEYQNEKGEAGVTYQIEIERNPADSNNTLTGISVNGITVKDFESVDSETVILPSGTKTATINVLGLSEFATITYDQSTSNVIRLDGNKEKQVIIYVTAQNGSIKEYYVYIQAVDTNNEVENIVFVGLDSSLFIFNKSTYTYTFTVPYSTSSIIPIVTLPNNSRATIKGNDKKDLVASNSYDNIIEIYAISEAGVSGQKYTIYIQREKASTSTDLASLQIYKSSTATPGTELLDASKFDSELDSYVLRVNNDTSSVYITATATNKAIVTNTGRKGLSKGENTFSILVTAEDGVTNRTINIKIVCLNDNNIIKDIDVDGSSQSIVQNGDHDEIYLNTSTTPFEYSKKSITIKGLLEDSFAKLYIDGVEGLNQTYNLKEGKNTIIAYAVSEYGTKGREVHIIYWRNAAAKDTTLDDLYVEMESGNKLSFDDAVFDPNKESYIITLKDSDTFTKVRIVALGENIPYKTVNGQMGLQVLNWVGNSLNQKFVITVTAESGDVRVYSITILKNSSLNSNTGIKSLFIKDSSGKNYLEFIDDSTQFRGKITLPYSISSLIYNIETDDKNATIVWENGNLGANSFVPGATVTVYFYAVAQDGTRGTKYSFEVTRQIASSIQSLGSLSVKDINNNEYITNFSSENRTYSIRVNNIIDKVTINATIFENSNAKIVSGLGEYTLTSGETKEIKIFVLAEDGSMDKPYTITIKRANNNSSISKVKIDGVEIDITEFKLNTDSGKNVYVYQHKNVLYSKEFIKIEVTAEDLLATVYGDGIKTLNVKNNSFTFTVLAQDKVTRSEEYRIDIYREEASSDSKLKNLELLVNGVNVLSGTNKFSSTKYLYEIMLTRDKFEGIINTTKNHDGQIIAGDIGVVSFVLGSVTEYRIVVTSEDKLYTETYIIKVTVKNSNSNINNIEVKDADNNSILLSQAFDRLVTSYSLGSLDCNKSSIKIIASLEDQFAKIVILKDGVKVDTDICDLIIGQNKITVYGVAEDGTIGTKYDLVVEREEYNNNTDIASIVIRETNATGNIIDGGNITVVNGQNQYTIYIGSSTSLTSVHVSALTVEETTVISSGLGINQLNATGATTIKLISKAQSNDTAEYIITIVKGGKGDVEGEIGISKVELFDEKMNNYFTNFNKDIIVQSPITVPYGVSNVLLVITSYPGSDVFGNGTYELIAGVPTVITFGVTSSDKTLTYKVEVIRSNPTQTNQLNELFVEANLPDNQKVKFTLDPTKDLNQVNISKNTESITIDGVKPTNASVNGFGQFTITKDVEFFRIVVSSLYGPDKEYIIQVTRKDNNTEFTSIIIDGVEKLGNFVNGVLDLGSIPFKQKSLEISATALSETSKVNGDEKTITIEYALNKVGVYEYSLYVLAEDGTVGTRHTIRLNRQAADNNANLNILTVKDNKTNTNLLLLPEFTPTTTKYSIDLTNYRDVTEIKIEAIAQVIASTVKGLGTYVLKTETGQTSQVYTVDVTAEDGVTKKVYEILIVREVNPDDDNTINDISLIGSDSINYLGNDENSKTIFELSKYQYTIHVPYSVKNITLYISNDNGATPYGIGRHNLLNKTTTIEFYMVSKSKIQSQKYTLTIIQDDPSTNNNLDIIKIDGKPVSNFDPNTLEYTVNVISEKTSKITIDAIKTDVNASISGDIGEINLPNGKTQWKINVKAEDGSYKTYTINVNRLSGNNNILDISVDGWDLTPLFDKDKTIYRLNVPYATTSITLRSVPEVSSALVSNTGLKQLSVGSNYISVQATAENGDKGTIYYVEIVRSAPSNDSSLKTLEIYEYDGGPLIEYSPVFTPTTLSYIINLPADENLNSVFIKAEANSSVARGVSGTGFKWLKADVDGKYHNILEIIVLAEDGVTTTTYTISIYHDVNLSKDITIGELSLIGSNGINYLGTGNDALGLFNSNTYIYTIRVPFTLASITLDVKTLSASVYGGGTMSFGDLTQLTFKMNLVSQDKEVQSPDYYITIIKEEAQTNNKLKSLLINEEDLLNFDPNITQYELTLSVQRYRNILISALAEDKKATVSGDLLPVELREGKQTFTILCKAENGAIKTYTVIINYVQSNALLKELQIFTSNKDKYDQDNAVLFKGLLFDPESFEYTLKVEKDVKFINISGSAQDIANALVLGFGTYSVDNEGVKVLIYVQSADGKNIEKYTINIIKEDIPCNNSKLKNLVINNGQYKLTFDPNISHYSINVKNGVNKLDVEALVQDETANVEIIGADKIENGKNVVLIKVVAEDGSSTFYQLQVTKDQAPDYFLLVMVITTFLLWLLTVIYFFIFSRKIKNGKHRPIVI